MKDTVMHHKPASALKRALLLAAGVVALAGGAARAQIATNFTIVNHATGKPLSLSDYQGSVVLLDFWAYWCEYCQQAASDIEPNLTRYYRNAGGNTNGVPVQVISVNIDCSSTTYENNYISTYGLEVVGDDCDYAAFNQFDFGGIPQFAVINCATNSSNRLPWQILTEPTGYLTNDIVPLLKSSIDSVQTPAPVPIIACPSNGATVAPPNVTLTARLASNSKIIKRVEFYNGSTLLGSVTNTTYLTTTNIASANPTWYTNFSLTWSNAPLGAQSVTARAYYGANGISSSSQVNFTVAPPGIVAALSVQGTSMVLSWNGGAGTYQVQCATNLINPAWRNIGTAGSFTNMTLSITNTSCFYRIIKQ
jgi:thiol-disulfide isomerase/thioredoxin